MNVTYVYLLSVLDANPGVRILRLSESVFREVSIPAPDGEGDVWQRVALERHEGDWCEGLDANRDVLIRFRT